MRKPAMATIIVVALALVMAALATPVGAFVCLDGSGVDERCERWVLTHDHSQIDRISDIAVSPQGDRLYAAGTSIPSSGRFEDAVVSLVAYDAATTEKLWATEFVDEKAAAADSLLVSPDGRIVYVTGSVVAAYEAESGSLRWSTNYDDGGFDGAVGAALSPDGTTLYVTGHAVVPGSGPDIATVAHDAHSGDELWQSHYAGPGTATDAGSMVTVSPVGDRVYVAGVSGGSAIVIAYEARDAERLGEALWTATPGEMGPVGFALASDDSRLFILGQFNNSSTLVALEAASGQQVWTTTENNAVPGGLALSPRGDRMYVAAEGLTGPLSAMRDHDYLTLSYSAENGELVWKRQWGSPGSSEERAVGVAVSPDGRRIYVSGEASIPYFTGVPDLVTISYSEAGEQRWIARLNRVKGVAADFFGGIEMSPDGSDLYIGATLLTGVAGTLVPPEFDFGLVNYLP